MPPQRPKNHMKQHTPKQSAPETPGKIVPSPHGSDSAPSAWTPSAAAASESTLRHLVYAATSQFAEDSSGGPPPPSTTCSVVSFNTPTNRNGQKKEAGTDPGTYCVYEEFEMNASFSSASGFACEHCSYRQYIKGSFAYKDPGDTNWTLIDHLLTPPSTYLEIFTFHEDGNGAGLHYGHRNISPPLFIEDEYLPVPRLTGCTYHGKDAPQWDNVPNSSRVWIELWFEGKIVLTTNENTVFRTVAWKVYLLT